MSKTKKFMAGVVCMIALLLSFSTTALADDIGADGYAQDAKQACEVIKSLI